jgi:hypothetical protein
VMARAAHRKRQSADNALNDEGLSSISCLVHLKTDFEICIEIWFHVASWCLSLALLSEVNQSSDFAVQVSIKELHNT